jgi:hypothetical protein
MATVHPRHPWFDLTIHHRWEDVGSLAIAVLVLIAPMFINEVYETNVYLITGGIAALIAALALLEMVSLTRWEEALELLFGVCLLAAPYVLGYAGILATWHMVAGALVCLLALLELWQDSRAQVQ